ncbi:hypothetical protein ACM26M_20940, partial [Kluyvera cryocrescens]
MVFRKCSRPPMMSDITGPKVAIVGHMDEVGFMVTHIDD